MNAECNSERDQSFQTSNFKQIQSLISVFIVKTTPSDIVASLERLHSSWRDSKVQPLSRVLIVWRGWSTSFGPCLQNQGCDRDWRFALNSYLFTAARKSALLKDLKINECPFKMPNVFTQLFFFKIK